MTLIKFASFGEIRTIYFVSRYIPSEKRSCYMRSEKRSCAGLRRPLAEAAKRTAQDANSILSFYQFRRCYGRAPGSDQLLLRRDNCL
jgi:hypothetical protein